VETSWEEEHCREALARHLKDRHGPAADDWQPKPNGKDRPPDFHLRRSGQLYAVEVTSLMSQYRQEGGGRISAEGIWKMTEELADEVEEEAAARGTLRGGYILTVDGPYDNFVPAKREIRKHLLRFILATKDMDAVEMQRTPFQTRSGQRYFLSKTGPKGSMVGVAMMGDGREWDWSVAAELHFLARDAIMAKAHKLRATPSPRILLLLDRHHFGAERASRNWGLQPLGGRLSCGAWTHGSATPVT
jgi:hypothetical protein